jgi:hypothetical protein
MAGVYLFTQTDEISLNTQNARNRVTGRAELGLFATGIDYVANSTVRAPKG